MVCSETICVCAYPKRVNEQIHTKMAKMPILISILADIVGWTYRLVSVYWIRAFS